MTTGTYEVVKDQRVKGRVCAAIGKHLNLEMEQIQELEQQPMIADTEGCWKVVGLDGEELHIWGHQDPVLRLVYHPGLGKVAESWRVGFLEDMMLVEPEAS
jgi:hypothetical protein